MNGLRAGRVLGFTIRIDSSWFILFFLILWTFSTMVFPRQVPGQPPHVYWLMGIGGTALFFASLLAHELSHSVVARAHGIPVEGITLFLFGGMAHTRLEAETPGVEFRIAVVGPLMSLFIAALLGGGWWLGTRLGWSPAVTMVLQYVGVLNLALAVFNLLPGFPLDGGRLFRALVWRVTGDAARATRVASAGGRFLGYVLIALGLLSVFGGNLIGGLWLVFIGWFLRNAAISSYRQHLLLNVLSDVAAVRAMTPEPVTVPDDATIVELHEDHFMRSRHAAYPVVTGGRVIGIVTRHAAGEVPRAEWSSRTAHDTMTALDDTVRVRPDDNLVTVLDRLKHSPARRVMVMRGDELLGIIAPGDIAFWLERARQETQT